VDRPTGVLVGAAETLLTEIEYHRLARKFGMLPGPAIRNVADGLGLVVDPEDRCDAAGAVAALRTPTLRALQGVMKCVGHPERLLGAVVPEDAGVAEAYVRTLQHALGVGLVLGMAEASNDDAEESEGQVDSDRSGVVVDGEESGFVESSH
jgi:hypothetical protein